MIFFSFHSEKRAHLKNFLLDFPKRVAHRKKRRRKKNVEKKMVHGKCCSTVIIEENENCRGRRENPHPCLLKRERGAKVRWEMNETGFVRESLESDKGDSKDAQKGPLMNER